MIKKNYYLIFALFYGNASHAVGIFQKKTYLKQQINKKTKKNHVIIYQIRLCDEKCIYVVLSILVTFH